MRTYLVTGERDLLAQLHSLYVQKIWNSICIINVDQTYLRR